MEDLFDAAWQDAAVGGSASIDAALASLIDIFGLELLSDPDELERLLTQSCPEAPRHVAAIVAAIAGGVPARLRAARDDADLPRLLQRCVGLLQADAGMDTGWASWAVRVWAHALALPTGAFRPTASAIGSWSSGVGEDRRPAAGIEKGLPVARSTPVPVEATPPAERGGRKEPVLGAARGSSQVGAAVGRPAGQEGDAVGDAPAILLSPLFPDGQDVAAHARPADAQPAVVPGAGQSETGDTDGRGKWSARLGSVNPNPSAVTKATGIELAAARFPRAEAAPVPAHGPALHPGFDAAMDESEDQQGLHATVEPMIAPAWTPPPPPSRSRARARAAWVATALIAAGAVGWYVTSGMPRSPSTTVAQVDPPRPRDTAPAAPTSTPTPMPTATPTPEPRATAPVAAADPSVAAPQAQPETLQTSSSPPRDEAQAAKPAEDAAVTRTAPPVDASRPVIAAVDVPRVVEGAPFTMVLRLASDAREVAAVERRVVERSGAWPRTGVVMQRTGLRVRGNDALLVPFRAVDAPASASVEFTAIGRDGSRSEPKTATVVVVDPAPQYGSASSATRFSPSVASAAVAAACTGSTCGTVVEAHAIVPAFDDRTPVYQLVVRMDDLQTLAFSAPYNLQTGSRVRMVDGRFIPIVPGSR